MIRRSLHFMHDFRTLLYFMQTLGLSDSVPLLPCFKEEVREPRPADA